MKKLRKVKKHWIAIGFGVATYLPMNNMVSAEELDTPNASEVSSVNTEESVADEVSASPTDASPAVVTPPINSDGTTTTLNPDEIAGYDLSQVESLISNDNLSQKVKDSITPDARTVEAKPAVNGTDYGVHYDAENQWYYVKVSDFTNGQKVANQAAVQAALQAANQVVMKDGANNLHTGVAVKIDTDVHLQRDQGSLSHYEVLTFDGGVPFPIQGTINGVANPSRITESEYTLLNVPADGLITYRDARGVNRTGVVLPRYNKPAVFEQIVIDRSLSNVRALYSDSRIPGRITTELVQFGEMWNSNENDTDARDHSVILIDNIDGLLVKNVLIDILRPQLEPGQVNDEFYKRGLPYYGKVSGVTVNDSNNVRLDTVNVVGANRAGIHFVSTHNTEKVHGTGTKTSLEKLVVSGQRPVSDFKMGHNNQVINSQLHHNRVAGLMFAYQENFIAENNLVYDNGHPLSGSTGYGIASSAGSYNNNIFYRKNTSYRNYRKGLDIHDANNINIVGNLSIGDRLNGISVYNRTYKMEHVIIENNLVLQIPEHRLAKDDLSLTGIINRGSDYAVYGGILLQTNEKSRDLSEPGSKGKFSISNNTIQGLSKDGLEGTGNHYVTEAIIIRMNEPYLDYDLDINYNAISGASTSAVVKMINSSLDSRNQRPTLPDFSEYSTALGLGSGTISFKGNDVNIGSVYGNPALGVSPFTFTESVLNPHIVETKQNADGTTTTAHRSTGTIQTKFRGSFTFEDNKINFGNTIMSSDNRSESVITILTNAEGIVFKDNEISLGEVTGMNMVNEVTQVPLINIKGIVAPTLQAKSFTFNTPYGIGNWPNSMRRTQPLIMLNNDIKLDSLEYGNKALKASILSTDGVVRYMAHNDMTAINEMLIGIASPDKVDPTLANVLYTGDTRTGKANEERDNRDFNLPRVRIGKEGTETTRTDTERYAAPIQYIFSEDLLVGQYEVIQAGKDGEYTRTRTELKVNNGNRDINSYDILASQLPRHYTITNVTDAADNPNIPGLIRADYRVPNGDVFTAMRDYPYGTTPVNGTPMTTHVEYRYENLPIGLKEETILSVIDRAVASESIPRIVVIGRGIPEYDTSRVSEPIPYLKRYVADSKALAGERSVGTPGVEGEKINIYRILRNANTGAIKDSYLVESIPVRNPLEEVVIVGTLEYFDEDVPFEEKTVETDTLFEGEVRKVEGEIGRNRVNYLYDMDPETGLLGARNYSSTDVLKPVQHAITYIGTKPRTTVQEGTEIKEIPFKTLTKYSDQLRDGETIVEQEGSAGELLVQYRITINNEDGTQISREVLSETVQKPAVDKVIVVGTKSLEQKSRIAFETVAAKVIYKNDPTLLKGTQKVESEGKDGLYKVIYLDTIRLSDGSVIETQEQERQLLVEMESRVILVGTKEADIQRTTKTRVVEEVVPFKRVTIPSQQLEPGKETVTTPGQNGILRYTYVDTYDQDGNLISSELVLQETIQEVVNEEVLVGETPAKETPKVEPASTASAAMLPATGEATDEVALIGLASLGLGALLGRRRRSETTDQ